MTPSTLQTRARVTSALAMFALASCAHHGAAPVATAEEDLAFSDEYSAALAPPGGDFAAPASAPSCTSMSPDGALQRRALVEVVDQGLGVWLQGVRVKARVQQGKFGGWVIQSLHLANPCYARIDLRPGDVVTSINGRPIARDVQAYELWGTLKAAPAIEVEYERQGKPLRLRLDIVD